MAAHNSGGLYDPPYATRGQQATTAEEGDTITGKVQKEINAVQQHIQNNMTMVSERGERLETLQGKTDGLANSANGFRRGANRVRKQMWWKDMKMRMCIIVGIIVLLLIIIIPSVIATKHH